MKKMLILILTILVRDLVFPQSDPRAYEYFYVNQINPLVKAQFGSSYSVGVEVIDTVIGTRTSIENDEITDPFGTLQHCVLFFASKHDNEQDSSFFGIFKNGSILWESNRVIKGAAMRPFATADINSDGQVDILTTWFGYGDTRYRDMWIFSWNGTTGTIINQVDTTAFGISAISGVYFELIDANSDGIKEIRSILSDGTEKTHVWSGTTYGPGSSGQQVVQRTFLPANQLTPSVSATVSLTGSSYTYNYTWSNNAASKQAIQSFYLREIRSTCTPIKPQKWLFAAWPDTPVVGWNAVLYFEEMIKASKSRSGFGLVCMGLPAIVSYYVQGYRATPMENDSDPEITTDEYRNDIFTNSVKGISIGPKDPPLPLNRSIFMDSLKNYINQSRSLGWITNDSTLNKYNRLCDSIKSELQQNNVRKARLTMDTVLTKKPKYHRLRFILSRLQLLAVEPSRRLQTRRTMIAGW